MVEMTLEGPRYYDRAGDPIGMWEWVNLFSNPDYQHVGLTEVGDVKVSTVWMGLDHNFSGVGPPLIFETMTLGGGVEICERYATGTEAMDGHMRVVRELTDGSTG